MRKALLLVLVLSLNTVVAQKKYPTGLKFDDAAYEKFPLKAVLTKDSYDHLAKRISYEAYAPPVMNQGEGYGTCVGFASTYYLRTMLDNIRKRHTANQAASFSPSYTYDKIKAPTDVECKEGSRLVDALSSLKTYGAPQYEAFPYPNCGNTTEDLDELASPHKIGDVIRLFGLLAPAAQKTLAIKKALNEGYPVVIGMQTPLSFFATQTVWQPAPGDERMPREGGHALCVIGYDDDQYGGAFRIVNSWGSDWADHGYCWIKYQDLGRFTWEAYQAFPDLTVPITETTVALKGQMELRLREGGQLQAQRSLQKGLVVSNDPRELTMYRTTESQSSGTAFKALVNTSEQAYVYMIGTDTTFRISQLFPYAEGISPALGPHTTVAYPADHKSITLDDTKGTDYLIVLFSKKPLTFNTILNQLQQSSGNLADRLQLALKDELIPTAQIKYRTDAVGFEVDPKAIGSVVPLVVAIDHQ
ncbi:C1 family peptidase [Siphonobacter sp.]|uniref:C1 family peptidase n=1 Tax=Siphonobacter sp. TaxID=1869184 RepID=UPI003B3B65D1